MKLNYMLCIHIMDIILKFQQLQYTGLGIAIYHTQDIGKHSEIWETVERVNRFHDKMYNIQLEIFLDNAYSAFIGPLSLFGEKWTKVF